MVSKREIAREVTERLKAKNVKVNQKTVAAVIDETISVIKEKLNSKEPTRIVFIRFGTFFRRKEKPRKARNPRTGEPIEIPERYRLVFRPSKEIKYIL